MRAMAPNYAAANGGIASLLQSARLVAAVAEPGLITPPLTEFWETQCKMLWYNQRPIRFE